VTWRTYSEGQLVEEGTDLTAEQDAARERNRKTLLAGVAQALQADLDYLALEAPTQAQRASQVDRLTRQMVAVLRLVADHVDSTDGT